VVLAFCFALIGLRQDQNPLPARENLEMIAALGFALILASLNDLVYSWRVKRWFREGEPTLRGK
jgi:hypothetical protein